jgi:hypothetical protein
LRTSATVQTVKKSKEKLSSEKSGMARWAKWSQELKMIKIFLWNIRAIRRKENQDAQWILKMENRRKSKSQKILILWSTRWKFFTHHCSKPSHSWSMTLLFLLSGTRGKLVIEWTSEKTSSDLSIMDFPNTIKNHRILCKHIRRFLSPRS